MTFKTKFEPILSKIEKHGVRKIGDFLMPCNWLDDDFDINDKTISFDGRIKVYKKDGVVRNFKKDDFTDLIDVQIKSSYRKYNKDEKFSICKADLKNYKKVGGIIFVQVVFSDLENYRIYAIPLLPVNITKLLSRMKSNNTISVKLSYYENLEDFEALIDFFLENKIHQYCLSSETYNILPSKDNPKKVVFKYFGKFRNSTDLVFSDLSFAYGEDERGDLHPITSEVSSVCRKHVGAIVVNGVEYFKSYTTKRTRGDHVEIIFNTVLSAKLIDKSLKLHFSSDQGSCFVDTVESLNFMKNVCTYGSFKSKDGSLVCTTIINPVKIDEKLLMVLNNANSLLDRYRIDKKNITISMMSKHEEKINILSKNRFEFTHPKEKTLFEIYNFFEKKLLLVFNQIKDKHYSCTDYMLINSGKFAINTPEKAIECSKHIALLVISKTSISEYIEIFVGYEQKIINELKEKYCTELFNQYINFALECIKGYDRCKILPILKIVEELFCFLQEIEIDIDSRNIILINYNQVWYRQRKLTIDEQRELYELKKTTSNLLEICCCNILLDNLVEFEDSFEQLSAEDQEKFKGWPIWSLYTPSVQ